EAGAAAPATPGRALTAAGAELAAAAKLAVATAALLLVAATLWWEARHPFAMPFYDDVFDRVRLYTALPHLSTLFDYLIALHNEHRILTTRLFALLDEAVFRGREHTQVVATNAFQLASAVLAYRALVGQAGQAWDLAQRCLAFAAIALLFINPNLLYTLLVPFQLQHAIMAFLCVAAAVLMSRAAAAEPTDRRLFRLVMALVALAVVASFTLGNAPVVLIAAAATAFVLRWRWDTVALFGGLAVAHSVLMFLTTPDLAGGAYDPLRLLKFALIYWGAPFLRFGPWPAPFETWSTSTHLALFCGAAVLGTGVGFGVARLLRPGLGGQTAIFGFMLLVIVIVTGLAAAHARLQFGVFEGGSKKYASFAALGWLGVLLVAVGLARERTCLGDWGRSAPFVAMLALLLPLTLIGYGRETAIWQRAVDANWENALAAFLHVNDKARLGGIDGNQQELVEYLDDIAPRGRSVFSYFSFRWGDDASTVLGPLKQTPCLGSGQSLVEIAPDYRTDTFADPGTPETMSGWAWVNRDHAPPVTVIAVDAAGRIVGVARSSRTSVLAENVAGRKFFEDVGWFGLARLAEPPPLKLFGLSRDGRHYCALGALG
ncbi:MAG TPA: hypothetical protein VMB84_03595, partial [Stellaceae bacterium]|nr:hypothetical protein [Stellaceae bacterium]